MTAAHDEELKILDLPIGLDATGMRKEASAAEGEPLDRVA